MPKLKTVYVVSFAPSFTPGGGVGGYDWFEEWGPAKNHLLDMFTDETYRDSEVCFRAWRIPAELDNDGVTEYIENRHEWVDLPQPEEWSHA